MRKHWLFFLLVPVIIMGAFSSCEEDFEINAPYNRIPIIYGLLDAGADTQFVMINRSFLGEGNALDFTQIEDSSLFDNVSAILRWGNDDNEFVTLDSIRRNNKDLDGIFYAPSHLVYYVRTSQIQPLASLDEGDNTRYTLEVMADGEFIEAETRVPFIESGNITKPASSPQLELKYVDSFSLENGPAYRDFTFEFDLIDNADLHEASIIFYYQDSVPGELIQRSITIPMGSVNAKDLTVNEFEIEKEGSFFYEQVAARIPADENVIYRKIGNIDYVLTAAGEDLSTYLGIGDPVSAVGQERPSFSNINDGDGVGIFSSKASFVLQKSFKKSTAQGVTSPSMKALIQGSFTREFCFCDPNAQSEPLFQCDGDYTCP